MVDISCTGKSTKKIIYRLDMPEVAIKTIMCYLRHVLPKPIYVEYLKVVMERYFVKSVS